MRTNSKRYSAKQKNSVPLPDDYTVSKSIHGLVNASLGTFLTVSEDNCRNTTVILNRSRIYAAEAYFYPTGVLSGVRKIIIEIFLHSKRLNENCRKNVLFAPQGRWCKRKCNFRRFWMAGRFWFGTKGRQVLYKVQAARHRQLPKL